MSKNLRLCSKCGALSSWDSYFQGYMCNTCQNVDKERNIKMNNKELEDKLFDTHMNTMYDLFEELLEYESDDLSKKELAFVDALIEWHEFLDNQEEQENND